ncbi:MAG: hypothetical protein SGJ11_06625 [Phycisphaerae bacterium]|nr:hypothetical protein [Phycisphaerae bacterium]
MQMVSGLDGARAVRAEIKLHGGSMLAGSTAAALPSGLSLREAHARTVPGRVCVAIVQPAYSVIFAVVHAGCVCIVCRYSVDVIEIIHATAMFSAAAMKRRASIGMIRGRSGRASMKFGVLRRSSRPQSNIDFLADQYLPR